MIIPLLSIELHVEMAEIRKKILIEISDTCGRLSYGVEKFLEDKKTMLTDHIRQEDHQIHRLHKRA